MTVNTMPGMTTQLNLQADQPGTYQGLSAQFSGDGFSDMRFDLTAVPADQYAAWVQAALARGQALDPAAYDALARPSKAVAPMTFAPVVPGLFDAISARPESADPSSHQEQ